MCFGESPTFRRDIASVFRVEEYAKQEICLVYLVYFWTLKMETIMFLRNVEISEVHGVEAKRTPLGPDFQRSGGACPNPGLRILK
jgi:hypothetical protein